MKRMIHEMNEPITRMKHKRTNDTRKRNERKTQTIRPPTFRKSLTNIIHNVVSSTPRCEPGSNSQL
jgi:hypothetical protein